MNLDMPICPLRLKSMSKGDGTWVFFPEKWRECGRGYHVKKSRIFYIWVLFWIVTNFLFSNNVSWSQVQADLQCSRNCIHRAKNSNKIILLTTVDVQLRIWTGVYIFSMRTYILTLAISGEGEKKRRLIVNHSFHPDDRCRLLHIHHIHIFRMHVCTRGSNLQNLSSANLFIFKIHCMHFCRSTRPSKNAYEIRHGRR